MFRTRTIGSAREDPARKLLTNKHGGHARAGNLICSGSDVDTNGATIRAALRFLCAMEFGAGKLFVDTFGESEDIYKDECDDGIASCAEEQAAVWLLESQEQGTDNKFVAELLRLTTSCAHDRITHEQQQKQKQKEQKEKEKDKEKHQKQTKNVRAGALGTKTRWQPRAH